MPHPPSVPPTNKPHAGPCILTRDRDAYHYEVH